MNSVAQILAIAGFALLMLPSTCVAEPYEKSDYRTSPKSSLLNGPRDFRLNLWSELTYPAPVAEPQSLLSQITMTRLPAGSMVTRYEGPYKLIVKHARRHYRKFWNQQLARDTAWMTPAQEQRVYQQVADLWSDVGSNGQWWQRNWWESLPPEKGGAPAEPYVHTIGKEIFYKFGPLTVSNTLKFRVDYVAIFDLNTDPDPQPDPRLPPTPRDNSRLALDFKAPGKAPRISGSSFNFKIRPHLRVGLPKGGRLETILRRVSLRGMFDITYHGQKVIQGECAVRYRAPDGVTVTFDVALLTW